MGAHSRSYYADLDMGLHQLPKLSIEHVNLTSYAKMKVNLAVQVVSKSMGEAFRSLLLDEVSETATVCQLMNDFFDCCNVRSTRSTIKSKMHFWNLKRRQMIHAFFG